ncbi:hypothetical protein ACQP2U_09170 [Nocardia sp. CA-084685]|uniref:hypothetical protein n=1 Tax=Nocardia sp. CA-084685 TaxID=3239970 RepID=UPI003D998D48
MTSDLPFDSDATEADDRAGDTAYRVATGVARVARAGAYVTGGALVATNGGPAPVHPGGGQRLDSWTSAYTRDPEPGAPSPVVTFPDPDPDSTPPAPVHSSTPTPRDVSVNAPFTIPNVPNSGVYIGPVPQQHSVQPWQNTGYGNSYQPGLGLGTESERSGLDLHSDAPQSGLDLGTGHVPGGLGKLPGLDFGHGDHGFNLPDPNGFLAPGANPFTLPRVPASAHNTAISESVSSDAESTDDGDADASHLPYYGGNMFHSGATGGNGALFHGDDAYYGNHAFDGSDAFHGADMFHGVGNPEAVGVFIDAAAAFSLHTELEVDLSVGPHGMYLATQSKVEVDGALKVEVGAGRVGDNIDRFSDWLGQTPGSAGRSGLDSSGAHGTVNPVGTQPVGGSPYSAVQPVAVQPVQPFAAPLPAPIAPAVAPAAVAPAVVAPAAVAAPVAATPLQTTIQPDVASTPVANVLVAPPGPSPLTAPAATVPALFEPRPVPAKHPVAVDDSHPTTTPVTSTPTTVTKTVPIPADNTTGHPTKTPDTGATKPGHTTVPDTDATGTTKIPTATQAPTTQAPTTHAPTHTTTPDDDDVTLPSTGNGGTSTGHTGGTTPSTVNGGNSIPNTHTTQPDVDDPTVDVPTVSVPTVTHSAPTVVPTPDIDIPTANSPAPIPTQQPHVPAPTMPAPVTPVKPPTHPIAAEISDPADFGHPVYEPDHASMSLMAAGLSTPLLPDPGMHDGHHLMPGLDITLI